MFKPLPGFVLIAVSAAALFASAWSPAYARQIDLAGSVAAAAALATGSTDCQAPTTIGEDYRGLSCFSASGKAQANASQTDPASLVSTAAASATGSADCQAPATVGEDYAGISCVGSAVDLPVVLSPFYPMGEDFSGMVIVAWPKDSPAAAHRLKVVPQRPNTAAGSRR